MMRPTVAELQCKSIATSFTSKSGWCIPVSATERVERSVVGSVHYADVDVKPRQFEATKRAWRKMNAKLKFCSKVSSNSHKKAAAPIRTRYQSRRIHLNNSRDKSLTLLFRRNETSSFAAP